MYKDFGTDSECNADYPTKYAGYNSKATDILK